MNSKKNNHALSTALKVVTVHECCQNLTEDNAELIWQHNNDCKIKFDCLKKLRASDIW